MIRGISSPCSSSSSDEGIGHNLYPAVIQADLLFWEREMLKVGLAVIIKVWFVEEPNDCSSIFSFVLSFIGQMFLIGTLLNASFV